MLSILLTTVCVRAFAPPIRGRIAFQTSTRGTITTMMCDCGFDITLQSILSRADAMGSVRLAVQSELATLDETFIPALRVHIDEAPSEDLCAVQVSRTRRAALGVMDALGEVLYRPELVQTTASDDIIRRHWRAVDEYWTIGEDEQLAVDMDGVIEGSARPELCASNYGEITRTGGRELFFAMGLRATGEEGREDGAIFVDLGCGAGRLVAQAWLELAPSAVIQRAVGVELAPSRHTAAEQGWAAVVAAGDAPHATTLAEVGVAAKGPTLILGSLLDVDLSEATHVYVASLLMGDELLDALWAKLRYEAPCLEVVASLREFRAIDATHGPPQVVPVAMNWNGDCSVYLYRFAQRLEKRVL